MKKVKELLFDLLEQYDTCEEITDALRSFESEGVITQEEYDYIVNQNWDELETSDVDKKIVDNWGFNV